MCEWCQKCFYFLNSSVCDLLTFRAHNPMLTRLTRYSNHSNHLRNILIFGSSKVCTRRHDSMAWRSFSLNTSTPTPSTSARTSARNAEQANDKEVWKWILRVLAGTVALSASALIAMYVVGPERLTPLLLHGLDAKHGTFVQLQTIRVLYLLSGNERWAEQLVSGGAVQRLLAWDARQPNTGELPTIPLQSMRLNAAICLLQWTEHVRLRSKLLSNEALPLVRALLVHVRPSVVLSASVLAAPVDACEPTRRDEQQLGMAAPVPNTPETQALRLTLVSIVKNLAGDHVVGADSIDALGADAILWLAGAALGDSVSDSTIYALSNADVAATGAHDNIAALPEPSKLPSPSAANSDANALVRVTALRHALGVSLRHIGATRAADNVAASDHVLALTHALLLQAAHVDDSALLNDTMKALANLCAVESNALQLVNRYHVLPLLSQLTADGAAVTEEVARTLANMTRGNALLRQRVVGAGWLPFLRAWSEPSNATLQVAALVALGNVAQSCGEAVLEFANAQWLDEQASASSVRAQRQLARLCASMTLDEDVAARFFENTDIERIYEHLDASDAVVRRYVTHTVANLTVNADVARRLLRNDGGKRLITRLVENYGCTTESGETDILLQRGAVHIVANVCLHCSADARDLIGLERLSTALSYWMESKDEAVRSSAVRAKASLFSERINDAKYADGILLFYPSPPLVDADTVTQAATAAEQSRASAPKLDIVFIHGVTGDPIGTWLATNGDVSEANSGVVDAEAVRVAERGTTRRVRRVFNDHEHGQHDADDDEFSDDRSDEMAALVGAASSEAARRQCWPRDWLPTDAPDARILSVGFELYLSKWFGNALPLETLSSIVARKLRMAGVGQRPVVFVTHSYGGLIVKHILTHYAAATPTHGADTDTDASVTDVDAAIDENTRADYAAIRDQCRGVVFYSTPHRGAELIELMMQFNVLTRSNVVVPDLMPNSTRLAELNRAFAAECKSKRPISTLAFGEGVTCGYPTNLNCYQVVSHQSANPRIGGDNHHFYEINSANHQEVCKPPSREDERYLKLVQFLTRIQSNI